MALDGTRTAFRLRLAQRLWATEIVPDQPDARRELARLGRAAGA